MISALEHRGPDDEAVWVKDGVALAHRRLSIIELSKAGAQPMVSACGRYVLVYNGEIYNHLDLRERLAAEGAAPEWRGHSDTETLLAGIAHWGLDETLRRSYGMFALALFDKRERRLSLARDRMGEKPLYWGWAGRALVFGSELKAIRKHHDATREICREALALYLRFAYVPAPRSIHPGIFKLEPGAILETPMSFPATAPEQVLRPGDRHGELTMRRYWSIEDALAAGAARRFADDADVTPEIERTLGDAVERQMLSDVPLGAFLSGGIDSSLIVALMQQRSARPIKTFTVRVENAAYNEAPHAAAVSAHLGTDHTEVMVTEAEAQQVIPRLPTLYDEPFADSSQIPTFLVSKIAQSHLAVALSGDAGDELFCGYDRYFWGGRIWSRLAWMPYPARARLGASIGAVPVAAWDRAGALLKLRGSRHAGIGDKVHRLAVRMQRVRTLDDLYRSLVTEWPDGTLVPDVGACLDSRLNDPVPEALADDPVGRMMLQDMRTYLPGDILCKVDRAAMGVGLETRVPFLDPEVIDIAARLPVSMRARDGRGKWALRQVLYKHVPREIIDRPKSGFGIPIGAWLRGPMREWAETLLAPGALARAGYLEPAPIRDAWREHLCGQRDWTNRLWIVLMFQAWLEDMR
ncbi:asparagine synthase (glutamine-hydrolysing) [Parvibaculum indicum]|nr:asparagine synthase (glutamine-hydrolysing) [Parvibaculum indicum]